ncbi:kinase-like domain-containing protein [Mycena alexandri]|uniref:Kinase-like domain-containing protein n=1 Tax=Mycena alexandri TaxID=1745969 RepID=A0AAD6X0I3_9AGAR|nr:kinase-like domain-containing protein [Mycena alexandri]
MTIHLFRGSKNRVHGLITHATHPWWPSFRGGNSDIYPGRASLPDGRKVAIKAIRILHGPPPGKDSKLLKASPAAEIWSKLRHPNVLPFLGVCDDERVALNPVLISPFYKFGHIGNYLTISYIKLELADRDRLVSGVASGLEFIHANEIVHGDLKVQNVLIDKRGVPCICDFGISKILNCHGYTSLGVGTVPYMAPELFAAESVSTTKESDVFSWALLVLEILTSDRPKRRPTRPFLTSQDVHALRPKRSEYDVQKVTDDYWAILDRCWAFVPSQRLSMGDVLGSLPDGAAKFTI